MPMLKNKETILKFFNERPVTVANIIECAKIIYEYRNYEVQNILSTNYLENIVNEHKFELYKNNSNGNIYRCIYCKQLCFTN